MINLIGLSGYMGSGKDTVADIIKRLSKERHEYFMWETKKFSSKLKKVASLLTGIPAERFEDQEFKRTFLEEGWDEEVTGGTQFLEKECEYYRGRAAYRRMSVREFLQRLGTEAIRDGLHTNAWVNALFADYTGRPYPKEGVWYFGDKYQVKETKEFVTPESHPELFGEWFPYWLVTDTRFPNEAQAIKNRGGIIVRVRRPAEEGSPYESNGWKHPSETSLDNWDFDYTLQNNGSLEDLENRVREMLVHYKIIENGNANTESNTS